MPFRILVALAIALMSWFAVPQVGAVAPEATAAERPACTIVGTRGDDVLRGTPGDDVICGRRGDDRLVGRGGDDILRGGPGEDRLDARGDWRNTDRLSCGGGEDRAVADALDRVEDDCESPRQGATPTGIELSPATVDENEPAGTVVGELTATDADRGDVHTFVLESGDDAFEIDGDSLTARESFDHEETPTLAIRVRVTDAAGHAFAADLTVTVEDVDDTAEPPPTVARGDSATVGEDSATTTIRVLANDTGEALAVDSVTQPAGGRAAVAPGAAAVTYQPGSDFCGLDTFTYTLAGGPTATVSVTVGCIDDAPRAVADTATVSEDAAATAVPVLVNDADADGGPRTITAVTQPDHGDVVITGGGSGLTYRPDADTCNDGTATDDFGYTLNGGSTAQVRVTVSCGNDAPGAADDSFMTDEDTHVLIPAADLLVNDTDVEGDTLTVTTILDETGGAIRWESGPGNDIRFTPTADLCGTDAGGFDYWVSDGNGGQDTGHVDITVTCVDDAPVAVDDTLTTDEDISLDFTATGLLANDTDADGDTLLTTIVITDPTGGAVVFVGGDTFRFLPAANACGADAGGFDYWVSDGNGGQDSGHVDITITCVNDAPVVTVPSGDQLTDEDVPLTFDGASTISVDDPDAAADDDLEVGLAVTGGTLSLDGTGGLSFSAGDGTDDASATFRGTRSALNAALSGLVFTPNTDSFGLRILSVTVDDLGHTGGGPLTDGDAVYIDVAPVPDAPVAVDDTVTVDEDGSLVPGLLDLTGNDTDGDGDTISVTGVSGLTGATSSAVFGYPVFEMNPNLCGPAAAGFDYAIEDGHGGTDTGHVTIDITCVDEAPTAVDDAVTVSEHAAATAIDVLANDADPDGDADITAVTQPDHGTVVITGDGTGLSYAQTEAISCSYGNVGADDFTYTLDGVSTATVDVMIECVNDDPIANDDSGNVTEDLGFIDVDENFLLLNDTDPDGDAVTVTGTSGAVGGSLTPVSGSILYAPHANWCGVGGFDYTISDGHGGTDTGHVAIRVRCLPDAPDVNAGAGTTDYTEDDPATAIAPGLTVTDADADAEITGATVTISSGYAAGEDVLALPGTYDGITVNVVGNTVTLSGRASLAAYRSALRAVTYENTSQAPSDDDREVTFEVTDDTGRDGEDIRTVTVTPVDDAPIVRLPGDVNTATAVMSEDGTIVFSAANGNAFTITDVDWVPGEEITVDLQLQDMGKWRRPGPVGSILIDATVSNVFTGTPAELTAIFDGLTFTPNPNGNGAEYSRFTIRPFHNGRRIDARAATRLVAVTPVNDAPAITAPTTLSMAAFDFLAFSGANAISIEDVDAGSETVTVDIAVTRGAFDTVGSPFVQDGARHLAYSGSLGSAFLEALANLTYASPTTGTATLTITVNDGGATGANPPVPQTTIHTITITVT